MADAVIEARQGEDALAAAEGNDEEQVSDAQPESIEEIAASEEAAEETTAE